MMNTEILSNTSQVDVEHSSQKLPYFPRPDRDMPYNFGFNRDNLQASKQLKALFHPNNHLHRDLPPESHHSQKTPESSTASEKQSQHDQQLLTWLRRMLRTYLGSESNLSPSSVETAAPEYSVKDLLAPERVQGADAQAWQALTKDMAAIRAQQLSKVFQLNEQKGDQAEVRLTQKILQQFLEKMDRHIVISDSTVNGTLEHQATLVPVTEAELPAVTQYHVGYVTGNLYRLFPIWEDKTERERVRTAVRNFFADPQLSQPKLPETNPSTGATLSAEESAQLLTQLKIQNLLSELSHTTALSVAELSELPPEHPSPDSQLALSQYLETNAWVLDPLNQFAAVKNIEGRYAGEAVLEYATTILGMSHDQVRATFSLSETEMKQKLRQPQPFDQEAKLLRFAAEVCHAGYIKAETIIGRVRNQPQRYSTNPSKNLKAYYFSDYNGMMKSCIEQLGEEGAWHNALRDIDQVITFLFEEGIMKSEYYQPQTLEAAA